MVAPPSKDEQKPLCFQTKCIKALGDDCYIFHCVTRFAQTLKINRNMIVLKDKEDENALTLVNPLLLTPEGEKALLKLGNIQNIVRLGTTTNFWDCAAVEDKYYISKFKCKRWAPGKLSTSPGLPVHRVITKRGDTPHPACKFFVFKSTLEREAVMMLSLGQKFGNVLIAGDCLQHQLDNPYINAPTMAKFKMAGFFDSRIVISKKWLSNVAGGNKPEELKKVEQSFKMMAQADIHRFISTSGNNMLTKAVKEGVDVAIHNAFSDE